MVLAGPGSTPVQHGVHWHQQKWKYFRVITWMISSAMTSLFAPLSRHPKYPYVNKQDKLHVFYYDLGFIVPEWFVYFLYCTCVTLQEIFIDVTYRGVLLHMCKKLCKGFCIDFKPFFKLSIMSLMMSQECNAKSLQEKKKPFSWHWCFYSNVH